MKLKVPWVLCKCFNSTINQTLAGFVCLCLVDYLGQDPWGQGFLTAVLLTLLLWGLVGHCSVHRKMFSSISGLRALDANWDYQNCLQILTNVPWKWGSGGKQNFPQLRIAALKGKMSCVFFYNAIFNKHFLWTSWINSDNLRYLLKADASIWL